MGNLLEGKVIAMTGAGRGIGRECALLAASEGARVVVNDPGVNPDGTGHDDGPAAQVVEEIKKMGGEAVANFADVSTMEGGESVIRTALDTWGRLDGLINLAAILRDRMIFNLTEEEWDDVIRVDLKGHFTTIKPASVLMRQQRYGRIVNFSSVSGLQGNSGQANYGAAKAGVAGLTRVAARDLGRYGVTVNCIAPGAATRLTATVPQSARELRAQRGIAAAGGPPQSAANRAAEEAAAMRTPDMVAPMTIYLLLDEAWNINGRIFQVAGGHIGLLADLYPPFRNIYKHGKWTLDELRMLVPTQLMAGIANPAPPADDIKIPGRDF
ncbi:MAG: short-chain dehydrogenase [Tepidiforma sp.]|jgi:NAD(P)-dependent dehydrogenase (short-subunit alcohol dehydrogenase family)|uniref:SDR family NAD(P)-dependent oxidoreductase n=1 Tax=Tepidiforma bonchosmolovskayae TaxID=2601677 RepID=A0ABX6C0N2_9CHLR|nr:MULTISPECIES: SDR family NAD(P)-dependent oxidoreductase [Tepidiforma]QFG02223.1 SDR family NAD(P)-dependent oxidoreductase [Tepidiforma bonchosmolovskayae]GIW16374.1 MAG: short-chain dehydrogenase [Tepidiforma sp.]